MPKGKGAKPTREYPRFSLVLVRDRSPWWPALIWDRSLKSAPEKGPKGRILARYLNYNGQFGFFKPDQVKPFEDTQTHPKNVEGAFENARVYLQGNRPSEEGEDWPEKIVLLQDGDVGETGPSDLARSKEKPREKNVEKGVAGSRKRRAAQSGSEKLTKDMDDGKKRKSRRLVKGRRSSQKAGDSGPAGKAHGGNEAKREDQEPQEDEIESNEIENSERDAEDLRKRITNFMEGLLENADLENVTKKSLRKQIRVEFNLRKLTPDLKHYVGKETERIIRKVVSAGQDVQNDNSPAQSQKEEEDHKATEGSGDAGRIPKDEDAKAVPQNVESPNKAKKDEKKNLKLKLPNVTRTTPKSASAADADVISESAVTEKNESMETNAVKGKATNAKKVKVVAKPGKPKTIIKMSKKLERAREEAREKFKQDEQQRAARIQENRQKSINFKTKKKEKKREELRKLQETYSVIETSIKKLEKEFKKYNTKEGELVEKINSENKRKQEFEAMRKRKLAEQRKKEESKGPRKRKIPKKNKVKMDREKKEEQEARLAAMKRAKLRAETKPTSSAPRSPKQIQRRSSGGPRTPAQNSLPPNVPMGYPGFPNPFSPMSAPPPLIHHIPNASGIYPHAGTAVVQPLRGGPVATRPTRFGPELQGSRSGPVDRQTREDRRGGRRDRGRGERGEHKPRKRSRDRRDSRGRDRSSSADRERKENRFRDSRDQRRGRGDGRNGDGNSGRDDGKEREIRARRRRREKDSENDSSNALTSSWAMMQGSGNLADFNFGFGSNEQTLVSGDPTASNSSLVNKAAKSNGGKPAASPAQALGYTGRGDTRRPATDRTNNEHHQTKQWDYRRAVRESLNGVLPVNIGEIQCCLQMMDAAARETDCSDTEKEEVDTVFQEHMRRKNKERQEERKKRRKRYLMATASSKR